jgi:glyoxylase-like metal-dependent hydrolase (beta-lactamase superfamily II)
VVSTEVVHRVKNRFFPSNTYLLVKKGANACIIIDPGVDFDSIQQSIHDLALEPIAIACTHGHFDHLGCIAPLKKAFGNLPYALHQKDFKLAKAANFFGKLAKINVWIEHVKPDLLFTGQKGELNFGTFDLRFENFPGHSDGSCILVNGNSIFGGDLIYSKGVGFNNFPGENKVELKQSILRLLSRYEPQSMIYPGHGESATLAQIQENNQELNEFLKQL